MARLLQRLLLLIILATLTGCARGGGDTPDLQVTASVAPVAPAVGPAQVTAELRATDGAPLTGAQLQFEATMTHAGMAPVFAQPRETQPGRYEAPLSFTMAGDWVLIVRGTLADGRTIERTVPLATVK